MKPLLTAVVCLATLAAGCGSKGTAVSSHPSDIRLACAHRWQRLSTALGI